jgi:primary-amine oxidase
MTHQKLAAAVVMACVVSVRLAAAQAVEHPLDPLTFQEYWTVLGVLRDGGHLNDETRFSIVNLRQPPKDAVWRWSAGSRFPREAFALVRQGNDAFEAVVDLEKRGVVSWKKLEGVQPNWLGQEYGAMAREVKKHPDFIAAMKKLRLRLRLELSAGRIDSRVCGRDRDRGGEVECDGESR